MGRVCGAVKWRTIKGGEERAGRVVKVENSEPKASERNNSTNWYFFESASRRGDVEGNKGTNEPTMTTGVKGRRRGGGKTRQERRAWKAERERERERERKRGRRKKLEMYPTPLDTVLRAASVEGLWWWNARRRRVVTLPQE